MWVLELGSSVWTVYLPCDKDGNCPVLDYLLDVAGKEGEKALAFLRDHIPVHGTAKLPSGRSRKLEGCKKPISEFRWHKKGPELRVFYFCPKGTRRTILCVSAFQKREKTSKTHIHQAEDEYKRIETAIKDDTLNVIKLNE